MRSPNYCLPCSMRLALSGVWGLLGGSAIALVASSVAIAQPAPEGSNIAIAPTGTSITSGSTLLSAQPAQPGLTADQLLNQALQDYQASRFQEGIAAIDRALTLYRAQGNAYGEARSLNIQGTLYRSVGDYGLARQSYEASVAIFRAIAQSAGDSLPLRDGQGAALVGLGIIYRATGEYDRALETYDLALAVFQRPSDTPAEQAHFQRGRAIILDNMGVVYVTLGDYPQALEHHLQARSIFAAIGNRAAESIALNNIAAAYERLGQYPNALTYYEQALAMRRQLGDRQGEGIILDNMGLVLFRLGQYGRSLAQRQQALAIFLEIGDRAAAATALNNLGAVYDALQQFDEALVNYQASLDAVRAMGNRSGEAVALDNIGLTYYHLGRYGQAAATLEQSIAIARAIGNMSSEGSSLNNLGLVYGSTDEPDRAIESLHQSIAISRRTGDRQREAITLANVGTLLTQGSAPEAAIVFFKQSVNVTEAIRSDLQALPQEQQESFTDTVADTYRDLAGLLLQQDRVLEAQQVLDLLKVQELEDYLQDVPGNGQTQAGLDYWPAEQAMVDAYSRTLTAEGAISFQAYLQRPDMRQRVADLQQVARGQNLNPNQLYSLQDNLRQASHPTALLYPLILPDRLELVLVLPDGPPIRRTVPVSREDMHGAIATFRSLLTNRRQNPVNQAQALYQWLMAPIAADLEAADIETILYAADGALRYVPLAALHDGHHWLIERFSINHITAASLTNFEERAARDVTVLAAAFSNPQRRYQIQVGDREFSLSGLEFAGLEVENISATIPKTTTLLDDNFSRARVEPQLAEFSILHFATHAEVMPGHPEESFILFGNGDRLTLRDIPQWSLPNADLVVLSACKTAVNATGNGEEILGFGYQIQRTGAKAAIASLWAVDDSSTQRLMTAFYVALQAGHSTADALRLAQQALIDTHADSTAARLHHPYYWAPFILIGNGL